MKRKPGKNSDQILNGKRAKKDSTEVLQDSSEESEFNDESSEFESDDDDVEELSDDEENLRKDKNERQAKKTKLQYKKDLYKPPTSQEISALRETENLYHSSLFRLQVEELLNEVKLKKNEALHLFLTTLKEFLLQIPPDTDAYDLSDESWINDTGYKLPMERFPDKDKGHVRFLSPAAVEILGSYPLGLAYKPNIVIDIGVEMPKAFFHKGDNLNYRYHRKRAMYLLRLTHELRSCEVIDEMRFSHFNGDSRKPCLLITPLGNKLKKFTICIFPYCSSGSFKLNKFIPVRNNVRPFWFSKSEKNDELCPTPLYNSSILHDLLFEDNWLCLKNLIGGLENVKDGIILLKIWAHQRELDRGYGGFGSFLQAMFVGYLLRTRKLNQLMSSYQIVRTTWLHLAKSQWDTEGISLCDKQQDNKPSMEDFHRAFELVFLDSTGYLNLCANISKTTYLRVKHEAELAIKFLDTSENSSFDALFMSPAPFIRKFDHFIILDDVALRKVAQKFELSLLDYGGCRDRIVISKLIEIIKNGFDKRIENVDFGLMNPLIWDLTDDVSQMISTPLIIGLLMNSKFSGNFVDKGPSADSPEALKFREFWGEKSELRRFQDSSICEAVVWPGTTISDKRAVCKHIAAHIFERHLGLLGEEIRYVGTELEDLLKVHPSFSQQHNGEEHMAIVISALEALAKNLRKLDLELSINSVQGISPIFRYTEVFPPKVYSTKLSVAHFDICDGSIRLKGDQNTAPLWLRPLEVVLHLETSSKWPDDLKAIRNLKAAFHIRLSEMLKQQFKLACSPNWDYVDVLKDGYIFRLIVSTFREIVALKSSLTPTGMLQLNDTEESISLEMKTDHLPKLTSALHGLQMQQSAFSPVCRLAKRWIYSQLLWDHINDLTVELLVASLFIESPPFTPPNCPQVGFLRFLQLLHSFDWKNSPLIVNVNNELTKEDVTDIQNKFLSSRAQLPSMFIATPFDKYKSLWTKQVPLPQIVYRLQCLAKEAQKVLERQFLNLKSSFDYKTIFRPPLDPYDVIIHLNPAYVPTSCYNVDTNASIHLKTKTQMSDKGLAPVIDYNPVMCYLKELKAMFGDMALFFYDYFGGLYIAVLWKPTSFQYQPFKVANINGKMIAGDASRKPVMITPNTAAIIEEFSNIGQGFVKSVTTKSEK